MPLHKDGKKAVQYNISELYHANASKPAGKKRGRNQIVEIAFAAARKKKNKRAK
jgi:hypothetical protein